MGSTETTKEIWPIIRGSVSFERTKTRDITVVSSVCG